MLIRPEEKRDCAAIYAVNASAFDSPAEASLVDVLREQAQPSGGFTSSPRAYNNRIFCLSEDGDTYVVQAGPEFKVLGKNSIEDTCLASPAIASGSLTLRTLSRLYRIGRAA